MPQAGCQPPGPEPTDRPNMLWKPERSYPPPRSAPVASLPSAESDWRELNRPRDSRHPKAPRPGQRSRRTRRMSGPLIPPRSLPFGPVGSREFAMNYFPNCSKSAINPLVVATHTIGPFRLDGEAEMLFRGAEPIPLGRRAVVVLRVLVERSGAPV